MKRLAGCVIVMTVASALLLAASFPENVRAAGASLEYSVEPQGYNNTARAGSVTDMLIPHVLAARDPATPSRDNLYVLGMPAFGQPNGDLGYCYNLTVLRSTDAGATFEPPRGAYSCLIGSDLSAVAAPDGTLFVSGMQPEGLQSEVVVLRSGDAGMTWNRMMGFPGAWSTSFLAYDEAKGDLYLGLSDYGYGSGTALPLSVSHDDGGTWSNLAGPALTEAVLSPQLVAWGGHLVLTFVQMVQTGNQSAGEYLSVTSSSDGGVTWSAPLALTPPGVAYCQYSSPFVAVSDGGVFAVAWYADTRDPSQLDCSRWDDGLNTTASFVRVSQDGGLTWSPTLQVGGPPGYARAGGNQAVAFDDRGRLYVVWKSMDPSSLNVTVHVAVSDRSLQRFNASTFTTRFEAQGGNGTMTEGLSAGPSGRVYLGWESYTGTYVTDPSQGIFVRSVAGRARGSIRDNNTDAKPGTELELRDQVTGAVHQSVLWNGTGVDLTGLPPDSYEVWVSTAAGMRLAGSLPVLVWGQTTFTVYGGAPLGSSGSPFPWEYVAVAGIASGAAASAYAYTRLGKEEVPQRKVRLVMYEYVRDHPGASFSQVRRALGLQNGAAAYHLRVLVRQGFLHTESRRHRRWYYPNGDASLWKDVPLSPLQASILEAVQRAPGIGVRELSRTLDGRTSSVADNVRALEREGVLRTERSGRRLRCFPGDAGKPA